MNPRIISMYPGCKRGEIRYRMRMLGVLRPQERGDDAYLRSNPETVRQLNEAIQRVKAGQGIPVRLDEIQEMLGLPPE